MLLQGMGPAPVVRPMQIAGSPRLRGRLASVEPTLSLGSTSWASRDCRAIAMRG